MRGAYWDTSKRIDLQNSTRIDALKAAKTKAEAMAATLGMKIAEPLSIEEPLDIEQGGLYRNSERALLTGSGEDQEAISPGSIEIRVQVRVSFRIVAQ